MKATVKDIASGLGEKLRPHDDDRIEFLEKHIFMLDGNSAIRIEKVILEIIEQEKNHA